MEMDFETQKFHPFGTQCFLGASFFSVFGDVLLVTALPIGMSVENNDIRVSAYLWLIPAIAMFAASFLGKVITKRASTSRLDYSALLIGIGLVETLLCALLMSSTSKVVDLIAISVFLFLYAFSKEGVPRLFYLVDIYAYFVPNKDLARISGYNYGLGILAGIVGTAVGIILISSGHWRFAFIIDSASFFILSAVIKFFGSNPTIQKEPSRALMQSQFDEAPPQLSIIETFVPFIFGVGALYVNHLQLLSVERGLGTLSFIIIASYAMRVPGMIGGFFVEKIKRLLGSDVIQWIAGLFFVSCLLYTSIPSLFTLLLLSLILGIVSGVYWPIDTSIRALLSTERQIQFNVIVLRKLAIFQFLSSLTALIIFSNKSSNQLVWLSVGTVVIFFISWALSRIDLCKFAALLPVVLFLGCTAENSKTTVNVNVPSLSQDMELNGSQTYAAMMVVNSTSAHLVRLSEDLKITGEVLKSYTISDDHKKYSIELNPTYLSDKDEQITAKDVVFTFQYYIKQKISLVPFLKNIKGARECSALHCELVGLRAVSKYLVEIELYDSDLRFVDKLASPWLVLLKSGRPFNERVGDCIVPYQTGTASLIECSRELVSLISAGRRVNLFADGNTAKISTDYVRVESIITNDNSSSPSLSVLSIYLNPRRKKLFSDSYPKYFSNNQVIRKSVQEYLHKDPAFHITPRWMQTWPAEKENEIKEKTVCVAPISVAVDNSLPEVEKFAEFLKQIMPCVKKVDVIAADQFFEKTKTHDLIFCWFTPDYLDFYNIFSVFDCSNQNFCYFDYKDKSVDNKLQLLKRQSDSGIMDQELAHKIDNELIQKGYVFPLVHLDWRIVHGKKSWPVHTAGLFQLRATDFVKVE